MTDVMPELSVAAGGVVFCTIHKFFPEERGDRQPMLSDRCNIVMISDKAQRQRRPGAGR
jgi:type I restriction enzyme R subunit